MKKLLLSFVLFVFCRVQAQTFAWPHHKKATIVLTYDDALLSQLDTAVPQLKRAGLTATFFLTADPIDGKTSRTYAYPCAETLAGGKDYADTLRHYKPVKYARIGGDTEAVITDFAHLDLLRIPSFGLEENAPASALIGFVRRVEQTGGMGVIMFHGIGGGYITTSTAAHQALLDYLRKNKDVVQQLSLPHV